MTIQEKIVSDDRADNRRLDNTQLAADEEIEFR